MNRIKIKPKNKTNNTSSIIEKFLKIFLPDEGKWKSQLFIRTKTCPGGILLDGKLVKEKLKYEMEKALKDQEKEWLFTEEIWNKTLNFLKKKNKNQRADLLRGIIEGLPKAKDIRGLSEYDKYNRTEIYKKRKAYNQYRQEVIRVLKKIKGE